jgi:hypothetical protein
MLSVTWAYRFEFLTTGDLGRLRAYTVQSILIFCSMHGPSGSHCQVLEPKSFPIFIHNDGPPATRGASLAGRAGIKQTQHVPWVLGPGEVCLQRLRWRWKPPISSLQGPIKGAMRFAGHQDIMLFPIWPVVFVF